MELLNDLDHNARLSFGPQFRIIVDIQNTGTKTMIQTPIVTMYNANIYSVPRALQIVPLMIPGLLYHVVLDVLNVDANGGADNITICLCDMNKHIPMIAAVVKMPICEIIAGGGGPP